jgi:hypothetical protein
MVCLAEQPKYHAAARNAARVTAIDARCPRS